MTMTGERILVLAPTGRDNSAACAASGACRSSCEPCSGIGDLRTKLEAGAGAAVIAEEAFFGTDPAPLFDWVRDQPPWSDFPFIVLTTRRDDPRQDQHTLRLLEKLRNVTLLERPDPDNDSCERGQGGAAGAATAVRSRQISDRARAGRQPSRRTRAGTNAATPGSQRSAGRCPGQPHDGPRRGSDEHLGSGS